MKTKYYEIICEDTVIGATCAKGNDRSELLNAVEDDNVSEFGELTKKQYDEYCDGEGWERPKSKKRYYPQIVTTVKLSLIK